MKGWRKYLLKFLTNWAKFINWCFVNIVSVIAVIGTLIFLSTLMLLYKFFVLGTIFLTFVVFLLLLLCFFDPKPYICIWLLRKENQAARMGVSYGNECMEEVLIKISLAIAKTSDFAEAKKLKRLFLEFRDLYKALGFKPKYEEPRDYVRSKRAA